MGKITIIIALFMIISCDKNSDFTGNNKETGKFIKKNTFINLPEIYYLNDINIIVKEFKDELSKFIKE